MPLQQIFFWKVVNIDNHTSFYTHLINYDFSVCLPMTDAYNLR